MIDVPTITLKPSGQGLPQVGFGLWKVNNETCADTVYNAIKIGYRMFDGAYDYGNEKEAGEGVRRAIADGLVKREELFITSKLWNTFHKKEHVKPIVKKQLAYWGLEYFDLFLMHFPVALEYVDPEVRYPLGWAYDGKKIFKTSNVPIQETWQAMEELVDEGLAKNIGVSNFQGSLLLDLLRYARIRPANLQIEHHPYLVQEELVNLCKYEGISVTAYSTFGPASFVELGWEKACNTPLLFEHPTITSIANKHGKTPAQVILRWCTQRGLAVIPKSNSQHRLLENLSVTNFNLTDEDIKAISSLNKNLRFNNPADEHISFSIFA